MIGARFDLQRLFERFNCFIGVPAIKFKYSAVVESVRVARDAGSPSEALIADRKVSANASNDVGLVAELIE